MRSAENDDVNRMSDARKIRYINKNKASKSSKGIPKYINRENNVI